MLVTTICEKYECTPFLFFFLKRKSTYLYGVLFSPPLEMQTLQINFGHETSMPTVSYTFALLYTSPFLLISLMPMVQMEAN